MESQKLQANDPHYTKELNKCFSSEYMNRHMNEIFVCIRKYLLSTSVVPGCVESTRVTKMNET